MTKTYNVDTYVTIPISVRVKATITPGAAATYMQPADPAEVGDWEIVGIEDYSPSKEELAIFRKIVASFEDDHSDTICSKCLEETPEDEDPPERDYDYSDNYWEE